MNVNDKLAETLSYLLPGYDTDRYKIASIFNKQLNLVCQIKYYLLNILIKIVYVYY